VFAMFKVANSLSFETGEVITQEQILFAWSEANAIKHNKAVQKSPEIAS
jgi:hypothetical protein